ncbi:MAG: shikimate kinase, partial [Chromatiaceae bacterium]
SCVGKTTIGRRLSELLDLGFFDLDEEIESFFGTSIERLQSRFITMHSFREEAAKALARLLARPVSRECVIALPPSGLMGGYLRVLKKSPGIRVVLRDLPERILERLMFYDVDSRPIEKSLTAAEKRIYLREIKKDITYFRNSYERADLQVDISGLDVLEAAQRVKLALEAPYKKVAGRSPSEQPIPDDAENLGNASPHAERRRA